MTETIREIAFDTETTGLDWAGDDRVIELGAVEMVNHIPTGKTFRALINPGRAVSDATIRITGITDEMLADKPGFESPEVVDAFLEFIGDGILVAHNASFDRGFLNAELKRCGREEIPEIRWVDTVEIARRRFPGAPASLDALCKRFDISLESRSLHGALLDAQLLASVYLELLGGRARSFEFGFERKSETVQSAVTTKRKSPLASRMTASEQLAHKEFVGKLAGGALWDKYN
ncbi:MAG: DNA polymerase III subunit epsilon [Pseudomonadota bacterium]